MRGCAPGLKYQAALSVAYGCGLRVSEIIHLKVADIDSARMLIRVEQGSQRVVTEWATRRRRTTEASSGRPDVVTTGATRPHHRPSADVGTGL